MSSSITVVGNLTKDPELKFSNNGKPYIRFSIADTFKDARGEETTSYYDVVAFDSLATNIADTFAKGTRVFVQGRHSLKEFTRKDGTKGTASEIVVDNAGPELRFAKAQVIRNERNSNNSASSYSGAAYASGAVGNNNRSSSTSSYDFSDDPFDAF